MSSARELTDELFVETKNSTSVVKPYVMSHGTLPCIDLGQSRRFYEEFLGLECVQHGITSMVIRCGMKFHIVCVRVGEDCEPCQMHNHWGVDVACETEVDAAYEAAVNLKEVYGIREIMKPEQRHGVYSFYMIDLNGSWWEIQHYPGFQNDDLFDFGDRFRPDGQAVTGTPGQTGSQTS
ncbi:VOC family protein [Pseudomonas sp. PGPR40]|uniref:VOC family protein n=1 Tax=Pseudomonas sp. PGPR40 TaxID=2913476 RepID=UPI001EDB186D|nr:VOC family protein [Pseudomonas sp. PGPR40]